MQFHSVFDIIGPIMVGPSSSHTAGASRISKVARDLFAQEIKWANIHLYGSFAKTYKGHGTDLALVGGLLGFSTEDRRMMHAFDIAEKEGLAVKFLEDTAATEHPNTVRLHIGNDRHEIEVVGISIGGGKVQITELNGFPLRLSGNHPAILVLHNDRAGAIASVTKILAKNKLNIGHMEVSRKDVGKEALMVIETDENVTPEVLAQLEKAEHIIQVSIIVS